MISRAETAVPPRSRERAWWLRALLVLQSPRPVFAALRDESDEEIAARQEPVLAVAYLAGIAAVLATHVAGRLLDDPGGGLLVVAAWTFFAGAVYGLAGLWIAGLLLHVASRRLGGRGSYRRARHVVAFALVPVALSLLLLWPLRLGLYGSDVFRAGGSDARGAGGDVLGALQLAFVGWWVALLVVGTRAVHGWSWTRALAAVALAAALPALVVLRLYVLR